MRQLDLFGIETEPQKTAPSQLRKAAMALRATPPSPASDTTTLVFADNKIGIKIKLKREITLTDDTTQAPPASPATEQEPVALQQLTLEEAILALTKEKAAEETVPEEPVAEEEMPEEAMPEPVAEETPLPEMVHQPLVRPTIISIEEEEPEVTAVVETAVLPVEEIAAAPVETIAEAVVEPIAEEPVVATAAPVAAQQWLVRPAIISVEEEEAPEAIAVAEAAVLPVEEIAEEPVAAIPVEQVAEVEPAVEAVFPETAAPTPAPAPLAARSQLVRPAIIEIEEEEEATEQEIPVAEEVPLAIEAVQEEVIVAAEEPATETAAITAAPEETIPAAAPPPPAKIKAPKPIREPALPKKRGRKSFKEIDAESDMLQLPDDEALFEKQYYPISVVAGWFNVNASLLRFWENEFDILKPRKNRKGDRLFRPEDVKNLQVIYYLLRQRKFTIEGAKEYLKTNKKKADTNTQLVQSLTKLRGFLLEFKANLHP